MFCKNAFTFEWDVGELEPADANIFSSDNICRAMLSILTTISVFPLLFENEPELRDLFEYIYTLIKLNKL